MVKVKSKFNILNTESIHELQAFMTNNFHDLNTTNPASPTMGVRNAIYGVFEKIQKIVKKINNGYVALSHFDENDKQQQQPTNPAPQFQQHASLNPAVYHDVKWVLAKDSNGKRYELTDGLTVFSYANVAEDEYGALYCVEKYENTNHPLYPAFYQVFGEVKFDKDKPAAPVEQPIKPTPNSAGMHNANVTNFGNWQSTTPKGPWNAKGQRTSSNSCNSYPSWFDFLSEEFKQNNPTYQTGQQRQDFFQQQQQQRYQQQPYFQPQQQMQMNPNSYPAADDLAIRIRMHNGVQVNASSNLVEVGNFLNNVDSLLVELRKLMLLTHDNLVSIQQYNIKTKGTVGGCERQSEILKELELIYSQCSSIDYVETIEVLRDSLIKNNEA